MGYYSLIQYQPDTMRSEGINVGVVLVCEEQKVMLIRFEESTEAVRDAFRLSEADLERLAHAKQSLEARLTANFSTTNHPTPTKAGLENFAAAEAGKLLLLPPRYVRVTNPMGDIEKLLTTLVCHYRSSIS